MKKIPAKDQNYSGESVEPSISWQELYLYYVKNCDEKMDLETFVGFLENTIPSKAAGGTEVPRLSEVSKKVA